MVIFFHLENASQRLAFRGTDEMPSNAFEPWEPDVKAIRYLYVDLIAGQSSTSWSGWSEWTPNHWDWSTDATSGNMQTQNGNWKEERPKVGFKTKICGYYVEGGVAKETLISTIHRFQLFLFAPYYFLGRDRDHFVCGM